MKRKVLVFDIDGLFANFSEAYRRVFIKVTGKDLFAPGDTENAPTWDFDYFRGYTREEHKVAWKFIVTSPGFWLTLKPIQANCIWFSDRAGKLFREHDIYFITNRAGDYVKHCTEVWLREFVTQSFVPTVLITKDVNGEDKGKLLCGLSADAFIDDKFENVQQAVRLSPHTHTYLYNRRYNAPIDVTGVEHWCDPAVIRIDTFEEFFTKEGLL